MVDEIIGFDLPYMEMKLQNGENILYRIQNIEDSKGTSGSSGVLIVTNLRLLWHSIDSFRINLSIGLHCIFRITKSTPRTNHNNKVRNSKKFKSLVLLALWQHVRYEFIFTNLHPNRLDHVEIVEEIHKAYSASYMYREIKMRTNIIYNNGQLKLLPMERVNSTIFGVWNVSNEHGNVGTFILTNIRLVWYANINENFNISLPYIKIKEIKVRDSDYGTTLVLKCTEGSGGYVIGFRIDPIDQLKKIFNDLLVLYRSNMQSPIFGVQYYLTGTTITLNDPKNNIFIETNDDDDDDYNDDIDRNDPIVKFDIANWKNERDPNSLESVKSIPIYSNDLGVAIESNPVPLRHLWNVM